MFRHHRYSITYQLRYTTFSCTTREWGLGAGAGAGAGADSDSDSVFVRACACACVCVCACVCACACVCVDRPVIDYGYLTTRG